MTAGYLFSAIAEGRLQDGRVNTGDGEFHDGGRPDQISESAKKVEQGFSVLRSFRAGGAISLTLAGESLSSVTQRAYWKTRTPRGEHTVD